MKMTQCGAEGETTCTTAEARLSTLIMASHNFRTDNQKLT